MWCLLLLHVEINHLQSILTHCQPSLFPLSCQDIVTAEWAGKSISWRSQSRQHFSLITLNFLLYDMQKKPHKSFLLSVSSFRMLSQLSEQVWADWIWFPEGHGWADLKDRDGKVFPKLQDLWATIPIALCFLVIRQIFERWVNSNCGSLSFVTVSFDC